MKLSWPDRKRKLYNEKMGGCKLFILPVGIPTFAGTYTVDYVQPLTASMVASIPMIVIYIIFEKQIVAGITSGAVKG